VATVSGPCVDIPAGVIEAVITGVPAAVA